MDPRLSGQLSPPASETYHNPEQSNGVAYFKALARLRLGSFHGFMKRFLSLIVRCDCCAAALPSAADTGFLPNSFAGWTLTGTPQVTHDAAKVDSAYPAVLQEYGFTEAETATYTRDDGRKLTIKAARFKDATGAYGAFTFYRQPAMQIGADRNQGGFGQRAHPVLPQQRAGRCHLRPRHRHVGRRASRTGCVLARGEGRRTMIFPACRSICPSRMRWITRPATYSARRRWRRWVLR